MLKRRLGKIYKGKGWTGKKFSKYNMQPEQVSMLEGGTLCGV
jgi:hypothetical protein